jgi:hypothetical protein
MNEGVLPRVWFGEYPDISEEIMIARDISLADTRRPHPYRALSPQRKVEQIRAPKSGVQVPAR